MNYIVNIDSKKFSVNGIPYYKNFVPHVIGDSLRIINQYDSSFELVGYSKYSQFTVNGQTFLNVATLQDALLPVLFSRNTLGAGTEPNTMLTVNDIERVDNDFTITAGETWRLNGVVYTGLSDFNFEIEPEELGFKRIDVIIATTTGYQKISGEPYTDIVSPPDIPDPNNVVIRKTYNVDGPDIDDSIPPITADDFVKRSDYSELVLISSGILNMSAPANIGGIRFEGTNETFQSLFINDPDNLWQGKPFKIKNTQPNSLTIKHLSGPGLQFSFPNAQDFVLSSNEIAEFEWHFSSANVWVLLYVGKIYNPTAKNYNGYFSMSVVFGGGTGITNIGYTVGGAFNSGTTSAGDVNVFGLRYLKITSPAAVGSFSNYRQNIFGGLETLKVKLIHESFFGIGNTELLSTARTLNGFVRYASGNMGNINPSVAAICAFCNDSEDSNLQLAYRGEFGGTQKINLGSDFPSRYTVGQHFYKTIIELLGDSKAKASILDLVTGKSWTSPIVDCYHVGANSFFYVNHMNNNAEDIAIVSLFVGQINRLNYDI